MSQRHMWLPTAAAIVFTVAGASAQTAPAGVAGTAGANTAGTATGQAPTAASPFVATGSAASQVPGAGSAAGASSAFGATFGNTSIGTGALGATVIGGGGTVPGQVTGPDGTASNNANLGAALGPTGDTTADAGIVQRVVSAQGVATQGSQSELFTLQITRQPGAIVPLGADAGAGAGGTMTLLGETYSLSRVGLSFAGQGVGGGTLTRFSAELNGRAPATGVRTVVGNLSGSIGSRTSAQATVPFLDAIASFNNGSTWRLLGRANVEPGASNLTATTATATAATNTGLGAPR